MLQSMKYKNILYYIFFFLSLLAFLIGVGILLAEIGLKGYSVFISLVLISVGVTSIFVSLFFLLPEPVLLFDKDGIYEFLNKDERKVLELIAEHGELSHPQLIELTGFSPAKVSRVTRKLEKIGLIIQVRQDKKKIARLREKARKMLGL
ncbi:MAG: hypothetical protein B6U95_01145 [Thermofilum sp. ex4484_82]|nr:MAG: hypothetical protein B6U95_01145 [Thermofilum sp. ex4484_82]OYT39774.1 MAG: hypothetical protein B6U96_01150 [Archaeoglobales archaeon ex4484_92]